MKRTKLWLLAAILTIISGAGVMTEPLIEFLLINSDCQLTLG